MTSDPVVIVAARRTPIGAFQGALQGASAVTLGAAANRAAVTQSGVDAADIDEVLTGCVLPAGIGQAPARQASLGAGIPKHVPCTTVNKVCGSGMKTVLLGHDAIISGSANIVLAGGMESMSNAPYLLPNARGGYRMGHTQVLDHMFFDGLQNPADGNMMGFFAEATADKYGFTREQQDAFSIESVERALAAVHGGEFEAEITPVTFTVRRNEVTVSRDEEPFNCDIEKIPSLRPAFRRDGGTVTAASSSSISDGAAAVVLMRKSEAARREIPVLATIVGASSHGHEPEWFTTTPSFAVSKLQKQLDWTTEDVDLYEVNEAFACVSMAAMHDVGIPRDKMNVNGGACALGHPIGATGARLIVTLIHALRARKLHRGIASQCIGGGEALAIALEV
ncbi:MAG: acetyl-CoA C-acyltransferase [Gammaproteobacteria bacterium]|nr:acetyl-CoA C-acyltransferase [Gammaproteobacteria bacterium]